MRNPYLVGTKVYLRPLEEADAAECHAWLNDPDVRRTLAVRAVPHTEASSRAWIRALDPRRDQVFAIVTHEGGLREQVFLDGRWVDEIVLGLVRDEIA